MRWRARGCVRRAGCGRAGRRGRGEEAGEAEDGRTGAGAGAVELEAVPVGGGGEQVAQGAVGADEAEYGQDEVASRQRLDHAVGNPGEAEQDDDDRDEAVVIDDVALRAVEVALPHGEEDGGEKPRGDGDGVGEERPPTPLFVRERHGFAGIQPEFQGGGADL